MTALLAQALQAFQGGDFEQAAHYARSFLMHHPDDLRAVHILASSALVQNMPATTIALIGRVLPTVGQHDDPIIIGRLYQTLGRAMMMEGHMEAARSAFVVAIQYFPEEASAHAGLGEVLLRGGSLTEAIHTLSQAIRLAPKEAVLWGLLGHAYVQAEHYQQAVSAYNQAQALCPDESSFYANQAIAYFSLSQWDAAHDVLEKALSLGNHRLETMQLMALVTLSLGDIHAAKTLFDDLLQEHPDNPGIMLAYGSFCYETGHRSGAEELFHRVENCEVKEESHSDGHLLPPKAAYNRSAILLEKGQWEEGWALYEKRKIFLPQYHKTALPEWDGSSGEGTVSLQFEGGWGDGLMFLRFLPRAAVRRSLRLDFPPEILELLKFMPNFPSERVVPAGQPIVAWQSLNSLPFILDEKPEADPYLLVPGNVESGLIGICWSGNARYVYDRRRSLPVSLFETLRSVKGVRFLSLQKEGAVPQWMEKTPLGTLSDLAYAIQRCALVISVDSLVANMAGAMGKDLWLLHRKGGDWRWSHHFWYQKVRLFYPDDDLTDVKETWSPVIKAIENAVCEWKRQGNKP